MTLAAYESHLGVKCNNFKSKRVSAQLQSYLVSQCWDEFHEVVPEITQITSLGDEEEMPSLLDKADAEPRKRGRGRFKCPVKNCHDKSTDIGTVLRHLEANHPAENYFFRTRFNCPQLQSRCVSCQYSFPSETYLKHNWRGYDAADHDDQSIDNIISDSLENEAEMEELTLPRPVQVEDDQQGLTKLRGFKCPIKHCTMKTERLAGILRHLFTRHGYEGLLFRLSPNVWGMSERCNDCGFHFDHLSNSLYKHKYDKACEKNIIRKQELQAEHEKNPLRKSLADIMANIDLNAFKERVSVDGDKQATSSPTKSSSDDMRNPYRSSPSLVSQTSSYSLSSMMNYSFNNTKTAKRDYYTSPNTDLIYRCPVIECGKAFSKLGGIFKHLVPAHGYQGVMFRMEHNVPGLSMICETCKWNYADKNAIYKHRKVIISRLLLP